MSVGHVHFETEKVLYIKRTVINADLSLNREIYFLAALVGEKRKKISGPHNRRGMTNAL